MPKSLKTRSFLSYVLLLAVSSACAGGNPNTVTTPTQPSTLETPGSTTTPTSSLAVTTSMLPTTSAAISHRVPPVACGQTATPVVETLDSVSGVEFYFEDAVSSADRAQVEDGVRVAQAYIQRFLGGMKGTACVQVKVDVDKTGTAVTNGKTVTIWTTPAGWISTSGGRYPSWHLPKVSAHEYTHVWQLEFLARVRPTWMLEGTAEFVGYQSIIDGKIVGSEPPRQFALQGALSPSNAALQTYENTLPGSAYSMAYLAVGNLILGPGPESLRLFFEGLGSGADWEIAFQRAFGLPVQEFYGRFEAFRSNGYR